MDNGLAEFNLMVGLKMTEYLGTRLLRNNKFLAYGWHIYSDTPGTLSFMCLKYLSDVMGSKENKFQYWNSKLVSILDYKFIIAKSESGQGFKKTFLGENIFGSACMLLWDFLTNIHWNAGSENFSKHLMCIL